MERKKLTFLVPQRRDPVLIETFTKNLADVFGERVELCVSICSELTPGIQLNSDLFLLGLEEDIFQYAPFIPDLSNVVIISRALPRQALDMLRTLPQGEDVLAVSDTLTLTIDFSNMLHAVGPRNINWIPYDTSAEAGRYAHIRYAVTPNERRLVPGFIEHVLDVGERYLNTDTMLRIANKLGLNDDIFNSRLMLYANTLAEPEYSITNHYFDTYLKSLILKYYVHTLEEGILLSGMDNQLLYANTSAQRLLGLGNHETHCSLAELFPGRLSAVLREEFTYDRFILQGRTCSVTKRPLIISGILTGFCITLHEEPSGNETALSVALLRRGLLAKASFSDLLSRSSAMEQCVNLAKQAASTDYTVLIEGESGTGKELLAQAIHNHSHRREKPFVAINCAAVPAELLESELFGYEGGAFTGARRQGKPGLFELADGGTIFLDEIGDMPLLLQSRLLRVLQEKQIMRVGGEQIITVDVRIVSATNLDLSQEVQGKRFRADLFYRLSVLPIHVPPLRRRAEDIPLLLQHFLGADFAALTESQLAHLNTYSWPGNIRQLQNFCAYFKTTHLMEGFFRENKLRSAQQPAAAPVPVTSEPTTRDLLAVIRDHTSSRHGIGRIALLQLFLRQGYQSVNDSWLRRELEQLCTAGYIEVGRGRMGCRITAEGRAALEQRGNHAPGNL